jgi:hypothetical protein
MNLHTAFAVYVLDGPCNDTQNASVKGMASRIVHAHLTAEEIATLAKLWAARQGSKAAFLQKVAQIKDTLGQRGIL